MHEPSPRAVVLAFLMLVAFIAVGAVLLLSTRPQPVQIIINPPQATGTPAPTATRPPILVYITGAVARPDVLVRVPYGSHVIDALIAVGGTTQDADLEHINLAGIVRDGDHLHVPRLGSAADLLPTPGGGGLVYINRATLDELITLPGIGPALGQRILDYREANGPFSGPDDLDQVSGIGPSLLERLRNRIAFD